ncbi:2,3-butanediol dehydrogenase [Bifidobacterium sp. ESL0704]|uniref:2,3-butanediol dehydrogenase n=1 Tax=Bifidobacterium sp. ESL0704 TaxID=2983219 RepID=UPI0023F95B6B|nr:2,3-butanediol dehydrogenase [Bifidobacterium sp. ESL0704]WEV53248.1 2,3-butanediol dehydrogenase [Bifidobacterium sp. ESL0704]
MKAVRYYGKEHVQIDDIPEPTLKPGTIKIHPAFTGICGSDLHLYYDGEQNGGNSATEPHPLSGETLPVVFGHEFSGTVEAIADDVDTDLKVGDRVVVEPVMVCGECDACKSGNYNVCEKLGFIGINGGGGGMSEHIVVEAKRVFPVGDMPLDQAALIEPLSVAYHAVRRTDVKAGDTVVVGGAGPIGLLVGTVLKAKGAKVIISELSEVRKNKALESGAADIVVDPSKEDLNERVRKETNGKGADVAFDCAGVGVVVHQLLSCLKQEGKLEIVAVHVKPLEINVTNELTFAERDIQASLGYANDHEKVIKMVREKGVDLSPFITDKIKAEDIVKDGFEKLRNDGEHHVKILVEL